MSHFPLDIYNIYLFLVASRRSTEHKTYSMWSRDALFTMQRKSPDEMLYSLTNRGHITGSMSYKRVYEPAARRKEMVECKYNAAQVDEVIVADL